MARFLTRVRLENFKSIAHCDVELHDLTFLVGPNGAGKSNFLSALRFTSSAVKNSLESTINNFDGFKSIVKANSDRNFSVILENENCNYELSIKDSVIEIEKFQSIDEKIRFVNRKDDIWIENQQYPGELLVPGSKHDLAISDIARNSSFTEGLKRCLFFSFIPDHYWRPEPTSSTVDLLWDGQNTSSALFSLQENFPNLFTRLNQFISHISQEVRKVWVIQAGGFNILQFEVENNNKAFNASQISDGTLHVLGVLTAIFYAKSQNIPLLCIEEPESGLYPSANHVLYDALFEISREVQIIITSHSPDLLDNPEISWKNILAVTYRNGETKIGPISEVSQQVLNEHLFTAGELLRLNRLQPAA